LDKVNWGWTGGEGVRVIKKPKKGSTVIQTSNKIRQGGEGWVREKRTMIGQGLNREGEHEGGS